MSERLISQRDSLLERIWHEMKIDTRIFFLSGDFGSPVIDKIKADFPDRFINVGIAEQNLINISAGLALEGFKVFAYAIAPFITMRCFEQIRVSLALLSEVRNLNVTLIGVGAGYSYVVSGPTHQCYEDISIMRSIPNVDIYSPSDHISSERVFNLCHHDGVRYIRLDAQVLPSLANQDEFLEKGFNIRRLSDNPKVLFVSTGYMTHTSLNISKSLQKKGIESTVVDLINLTNFSYGELLKLTKNVEIIATCEEGFIERAGLDSIISSFIREFDLPCKMLCFGLPPVYSFDLGTREELHNNAGIGNKQILDDILRRLGKL